MQAHSDSQEHAYQNISHRLAVRVKDRQTTAILRQLQSVALQRLLACFLWTSAPQHLRPPIHVSRNHRGYLTTSARSFHSQFVNVGVQPPHLLCRQRWRSAAVGIAMRQFGVVHGGTLSASAPRREGAPLLSPPLQHFSRLRH